MSERSRVELDDIRLKQRDGYERELKSLREARDDALRETDRQREALRSKSAAYDQLMLEYGSDVVCCV